MHSADNLREADRYLHRVVLHKFSDNLQKTTLTESED